MSQIKPQFKLALGAIALMCMLGFVQVKSEEPNNPQNSLYVEPCNVDYTKLNHVTCTAYISIAGKEYQALIESVDYTYLTDVSVDYVLVEYPGDAVIEKQINNELISYFDDRRAAWFRRV